MSSSTTYTVFVNGTEGESRSKKAKGVELAEIALANNPEATVELRTAAGNVVWPVAEAEAEVEAPVTEDGEAAVSNRAKPYTRTDQSEVLPAEVDGYELAYKRPRVNAGVYRQGKDYLVVQFKAGEEILREEASNTKEAREITNRLADEHRVAVQAAKDAEKAQKAADKQAKADAKAAALAEKEAAAAATEQPEVELEASVA